MSNDEESIPIDAELWEYVKEHYNCKNINELRILYETWLSETHQHQQSKKKKEEAMANLQQQIDITKHSIDDLTERMASIQIQLDAAKQTLPWIQNKYDILTREVADLNESEVFNKRKINRLERIIKQFDDPMPIDPKLIDALRERYAIAKKAKPNLTFTQFTKNIIYTTLGGYQCKKCDATDPDVLQLDHIRDDGNIDRKRFKTLNRLYLYYAVYPDKAKERLQVLCSNHNWKKQRVKITNRMDARTSEQQPY